MSVAKEKKILIVGGGFAGIQVALDLAEMNLPDTKISLISDKHHFEYTPLLYRIVSGRNPMEVCIPIEDIFKHKNISFDVDTIIGISPEQKTAVSSGGVVYNFDFVVLALGSEAVFFGIEGMKDFSFSFKSIDEALRLKQHIHFMFEEALKRQANFDVSEYLNVTVVGGGPSGVELAGELTEYLKRLSKIHNIKYDEVHIFLVEAGDRILSMLSKKFSQKAMDRLHKLGVKVLLNEKVEKVEKDKVLIKNGSINTKTIIWASGVRPKEFYFTIPNIRRNDSGRVFVDDQLDAISGSNIFVVGDGAGTKYSGMAQTAIYDGVFVSKVIASKILNKKAPSYFPKKVGYSIPIGRRWAIFSFGNFSFSGFLAWVLRKIIDFRFMLRILPLKKAIGAVSSNTEICENCPTCMRYIKKHI